MKKILFMNFSPNKNGNTYRIGKELLGHIDYDTLQMVDYKIHQYGQVDSGDQIKEVLNIVKDYDTVVIGSPIYWYTVGGMLKTFIDRLYMLPEADNLKDKNLYLFAQGTAPDQDTIKSITFLANRLSTHMNMNLKRVVVDSSNGRKILNNISITN